jgi:dTDP-4-dehydrorhamnose 3,5-epimerase
VGKFRKISTPIEGLFVIEPTLFGDDRGFFMEAYNKKEFTELGIECDFVQDNHSRSVKGVLRGLHFQAKHQQAKLVRVVNGGVFDVAVDLRRDSTTFGKWYGLLLSAENKKMTYIPEGFAHGFLVVSEVADFQYKCSEFYCPSCDTGIIWNDPDIAIDWPLKEFGIEEVLLSNKDSNLPVLKYIPDF